MSRSFSTPILAGAGLCSLLACAWLGLPTSATAAAEGLVLVPTNLVLHGPEARQRLLVERFRDGMFLGEITNATVTSADPSIVRIENRFAVPVKNGQTTVTAQSGKRAASTTITVEGMDRPFDWTFRNHVQPVLARNGCSAGACHGAAAG